MEVLPVLEGRMGTLRPLVAGEAKAFAVALSQDEGAHPWIGYEASVLEQWFADAAVHAFAVEEGGVAHGVITFEEQLDPDYRSANIDIALLSSGTNRGLGTDAIRTLAHWLFEQRDHHRITIDPAVGNSRAVRSYEKVGFKPVGIMRQYERGPDGTWHDNLLMDLLKDEFAE